MVQPKIDRIADGVSSVILAAVCLADILAAERLALSNWTYIFLVFALIAGCSYVGYMAIRKSKG